MIRDITNLTFARLTAAWPVGHTKNRQVMWLFFCQCGGILVVSGVQVTSGHTKSCGCLQPEVTANRATHGHSRRRLHGYGTNTYKAWQHMKDRCLNSQNKDWKYYGGRGILICDRWMKFENFLADMGECPKGLTIERQNNDGNYEPGNCKWATRLEQGRNSRIGKRVFNGSRPKTHCKRGHLLTPETVYTYKTGCPGGKRVCKACHRLRGKNP